MSSKTFQIKLTRMKVAETLPEAAPTWPRTAGVPLVVHASGTNMPSDIFVYRIGLSEDPIPADRFECVASLQQMDVLPARVGLTTTTLKARPYYRHFMLEFQCANHLQAEETWVAVREDVNALVREWSARSSVQEEAQVVICDGAECGCPVTYALYQ